MAARMAVEAPASTPYACFAPAARVYGLDVYSERSSCSAVCTWSRRFTSGCGGERNVTARSCARSKRRLWSSATALSLRNEDQQQTPGSQFLQGLLMYHLSQYK